MKLHQLIFLFIIIQTHTLAQVSPQHDFSPPGKNIIYLELLGNGGLYSFNYMHILPFGSITNGFIRGGLSEWHAEDKKELNYILIGEVGIIEGGPKHFVDFGVGYSHHFTIEDRFVVFRASYLFVGPNGLFLRISPLTYIYNMAPDSFGGYWWSLGAGYAF